MKFVRDVFQAIQDMVGGLLYTIIAFAIVIGVIALFIKYTMVMVILCSIVIITFSIAFKMDNNKRGIEDDEPTVFFSIGLLLAVMSTLVLVFG